MNADQQIKVAHLLKTSSEVIRDQQTEIDQLRGKLASIEKEARLRKTAEAIYAKGMTADPVDEIVQKLAQLSDDQFSRYEQAVEIASPNLYNNYLTTELNKQAGRDATPGIQGLTALDQFIAHGG